MPITTRYFAMKPSYHHESVSTKYPASIPPIRFNLSFWLITFAVLAAVASSSRADESTSQPLAPSSLTAQDAQDATQTASDEPATVQPAAKNRITIESVIVTVSEQVEVPSAEAGVLASIAVKPGQFVEAGTLIASLRDEDVRLLVERTRTNAEIATREFENDLNEIYAGKTTEVARAELLRATESNLKYAKTVSQTELDRLRLLVQQGEVGIQKAEHERKIAGLTNQIRLNEYQTALNQLSLRQMSAPLRGMVVEVHRRPGEWVQPGEAVARIIRLDRLRVEGFLPASQGRLSLVGQPASVYSETEDDLPIELSGEVVFVSPEIDPINSQVRIWIEIDNGDLRLRPGMTASVTVEPR
jgi:RND family efflux transporter MFP subunit